MRKLVLVMLTVAPLAASAATWANAPLVDHNCMEKVKANPDTHTTACLLQCASSGYGILEEGKWIPFDKEGNEKVVAALKATSKKDHIRVNVTGKEEGSKIHVTALSIAP